MDNDTRELFDELTSALRAFQDSLIAQQRINDLVQTQLASLGQRQDAFSAALRALAADPGEVADAILQTQLASLGQRQDAFSAALRARAADPGEVADAILKVVRDDADA